MGTSCFTSRIARAIGLAAVVAAIWFAAGARPGAHAITSGFITFTAGQPITGRPVEMQISLQGLGGMPATLANSMVLIEADMTAHRMTPVTATLAQDLPDYKRGGTIAFTMPGEWRITVKVIEQNEAERVAVFPLTVLRSDAVPAANSLTIQVDLESAPNPTVFDPWNVVWAGVGLVVLLEAFAVVGYLRRATRTEEPLAAAAVGARETVGE